MLDYAIIWPDCEQPPNCRQEYDMVRRIVSLPVCWLGEVTRIQHAVNIVPQDWVYACHHKSYRN